MRVPHISVCLSPRDGIENHPSRASYNSRQQMRRPLHRALWLLMGAIFSSPPRQANLCTPHRSRFLSFYGMKRPTIPPSLRLARVPYLLLTCPLSTPTLKLFGTATEAGENAKWLSESSQLHLGTPEDIALLESVGLAPTQSEVGGE